ncbi:hypothetical protein STEG23_012283, partial [Scotinomys teguina]
YGTPVICDDCLQTLNFTWNVHLGPGPCCFLPWPSPSVRRGETVIQRQASSRYF